MLEHSKLKILLIFSLFLMVTSIVSNNTIISDDSPAEVINTQDNNTYVINLKLPKKSDSWTLDFIHIDGNWTNAQLEAWCKGDGSWSNPYIIENVTIDASTTPTGCGIFVNNSKNDYFIVQNCTIRNLSFGSPSKHYGGIKLENTCNGTLINNTCTNNTMVRGIILYNNCNNNTIANNILNDNYAGIYLDENCENNIILNNTVYDNYYGIYCDSCDNNNFTENLIVNNTNIGVFIVDIDCEGNLFYKNRFIGNQLHAKDDSDPNDNYWNSTSIGNYWDNYTGVDANGDGIGDTPYYIPGLAGNKDYLPIYGPPIPPSPPTFGDGDGGEAEAEAHISSWVLLAVFSVVSISVIGVYGISQRMKK